MADCYFPEVATWFNQFGPEGALHMMMGRIEALEGRLAALEQDKHGEPMSSKKDKPAEKDLLPKLS